MKNVFFVNILCLFFFTSCGNQLYKKAEDFEKILETSTGQQQSVAKLNTSEYGYVVYKNEVTGEFTAYNLTNFNGRKMETMSEYLAVVNQNVDIISGLTPSTEWVKSGYWTDEYETETQSVQQWDYTCECYNWVSYDVEVYVGPSEWIDTSGWITYYSGGGFKFDNTSTQSKDLETIAALEEAVATKFISYKLSSEFSLSSNRAMELAGLALKYKKLENARALTALEKDSFALKTLGVSMTQVESALQDKYQGDEEAFKALLNQAAEVNQTTPEQIGRFFETYME